jgi:hypothetical protein
VAVTRCESKRRAVRLRQGTPLVRMPQGDGGVLLCTRGFNPIDVLVEDALVGGPAPCPPDTGDTVEAFTDFIDRLLTQVDCSPSCAPAVPILEKRARSRPWLVRLG